MKFEEIDDTKSISDTFILLDCRETCYFNGWPEVGFNRGGHLPGAVDFSHSWLKCNMGRFKHSLNDVMMDKGIFSNTKVVAYSSNVNEAIEVALFLASQGVRCIKIYNCTKYFNDTSLPLQRYTNYRYLICEVALSHLLCDKEYDSVSPVGLKYFEVSYGDETVEYLSKGHVPGSVHIDTNEIEYAPLWKLHDDDQLFQFLANNGIQSSDRIVLSGWNMLASSRVAVILRYLGVSEVYVLDGGTASYADKGGLLEFTGREKVPCSLDQIDRGSMIKLIDTIDEVESFVSDMSGTKVLLDVRTAEEYSGSTAGYSDLRFKGHVRGAVFHGGSRSTSCQSVFDYTNPDGSMRNFEEVLHMWSTKATRTVVPIDTDAASDCLSQLRNEEQVSIDPDRVSVSLMCGSGWRTSQILLYCLVYGLSNVTMYSNGWYEWSATHYNDANKTCKHTVVLPTE